MLKSLTAAVLFTLSTPVMTQAKDAEIPAEEIVGQADISVGLAGLVCDFCSIALNKMFKKNDAVAATYVDLDTKTLSVMLKDGQDMDDATVKKLVEKAGYNVTAIDRKPGKE